MTGLGAYTEITNSEAERQWGAIAARTSPLPGHRQEPFVPVETLLCYGLMLIMNPHRYGGRNIHAAPLPLHRLAASVKRSPRSLLEKMFNLDGSRPHRAKHEWELFVFLEENLPFYATLYRRCLAAARARGFDPDSVPDFLGLESGGDLVLLGQHELTITDVQQVLGAEMPAARAALGASEGDTEKLLLSRIRLGQHRFAAGVLARCLYECVFCGLAPNSLSKHGLVVASHVKPWRISSPAERLTADNGLAACPTHDRAFDRGLLTIAPDLQITLSAALRASLDSDQMVDHYFGTPPLRRTIPNHAAPRAAFADYHRSFIFSTA